MSCSPRFLVANWISFGIIVTCESSNQVQQRKWFSLMNFKIPIDSTKLNPVWIGPPWRNMASPIMMKLISFIWGHKGWNWVIWPLFAFEAERKNNWFVELRSTWFTQKINWNKILWFIEKETNVFIIIKQKWKNETKDVNWKVISMLSYYDYLYKSIIRLLYIIVE